MFKFSIPNSNPKKPLVTSAAGPRIRIQNWELSISQISPTLSSPKGDATERSTCCERFLYIELQVFGDEPADASHHASAVNYAQLRRSMPLSHSSRRGANSNSVFAFAFEAPRNCVA